MNRANLCHQIKDEAQNNDKNQNKTETIIETTELVLICL